MENLNIKRGAPTITIYSWPQIKLSLGAQFLITLFQQQSAVFNDAELDQLWNRFTPAFNSF